MNRDSWNNRAVKYAEFSCGVGEEIVDEMTRHARDGQRLLLVHSLRYADDDTPVFSSIEEVRAQPFRLVERLYYLAAKCAFANGMRDADPDAVVSPDAQANGHAEAAGPSH